jgi:LacI family transcriptional regulator
MRRKSRTSGAAQPVGLREVAEIAGVSTATVSRAMNNPELVSPELRERVASVVQRLGWIPHGTARALVTRRTNAIGAVFPAFTHGDFGGTIDGLQNELSKKDYTLLLARCDYDYDQEFQQVRKFVERGVDAVLLVGEEHHHDLEPFLVRARIPHLNMYVYNPKNPGASIGPDNHRALARLTRYLVELGHRRFGVIAQDMKSNDRARARVRGITDALAEHGVAVRPEHLVQGGNSIHEGRELLRQIVACEPQPTAVICGNGYLAVGAMLESQALGIRVPDALSIAAWDDIEIMRELPIPITTVRALADEVGRRVGRRIVALIEEREAVTDSECEAELLVRASTGPAPA